MTASPALSVDGHRQAVRQPRRGRRHLVRGAARRGLRHPRPERRRQVDDAAHDQRHHRARRRHDPDPRRTTRRARPRPRSIGYLPEERGLYPKMRVVDMIVFMGELRGLSSAEAQAARDRLARAARARPVAQEQGPGPVQGHAAEGAVRDRADPRARAGDPRRAVERPRPDQRRRPARGGRGDPRGRPHGAVLDPPDGAGRARSATRCASSPAARRCSTATCSSIKRAAAADGLVALALRRRGGEAGAREGRSPTRRSSSSTARRARGDDADCEVRLADGVAPQQLLAGAGGRRASGCAGSRWSMPTLHQIFVERVGRGRRDRRRAERGRMSRCVTALVIARREFLERVRTKWFVAMTLLGPLFMIALIVVPVLLAIARHAGAKIEIVDETGLLGPELAGAFAPRAARVGSARSCPPTTPTRSCSGRSRTRRSTGFIRLAERRADRRRDHLPRATTRPTRSSSITLRTILTRLLISERSADQLHQNDAQITALLMPPSFKALATPPARPRARIGGAMFVLGYIDRVRSCTW